MGRGRCGCQASVTSVPTPRRAIGRIAERRREALRNSTHDRDEEDDDYDDEHDPRVPLLFPPNPGDGFLQNPRLAGPRTVCRVVPPE